ncbi:MAG: isochorismatase family protein [Bacteroidetes bacterium]|nr:isochorismatase family protein [Bacteroidota bacterium]
MKPGILVVDLIDTNQMKSCLDSIFGQFYYADGRLTNPRRDSKGFSIRDHPDASEYRLQELGIARVKKLLEFGSRHNLPICGTQAKEDDIDYYHLLAKEFAKHVGEGRMINKPHDDSFKDTELHEKLQRDGVTDLVVAGYNLQVCVIKTVRSAVELGYRVITSPEYMFWDVVAFDIEGELETLQRITDFHKTADGVLSHLEKAVGGK